MKKRALRKEFFMEIKKSLPRFLSILFIVALGTAFYSGIQSAAPDMRYSGDAYFDERELMHLKTVSTLGLTEEDVKALEQLDGIEEAEPGYLLDVLCGEGAAQRVLRLESMPQRLNLLSLEEGEYPKKAGEILLDQVFASDMGVRIGDTIEIREDSEDTLLKSHTYTVTGTGSSPQYLAFSRGNTNIGNGNVDGFGYIPAEDFDTDYYMQIYMKVKGAKETVAYGEEYDAAVETARAQVEAIEEERCDARYAQVRQEAQDKIDDAKQELADGKAEADEKLKDAETKLEDAREKLEDGKKQVADAREELEEGRKQIEENRSKLTDAKQELADGGKKLADAKQELSEKEKEYKDQKKKADKQLKKSRKELDDGWKEYHKNRQDFETKRAEFEEKQGQYHNSKAQYDQKKSEYDAGTAQLSAGKKQYSEGVASLNQARAAAAQLEAAIAAGIATPEQQAQAAALKTEIAKAEQTLPAMKAQLDASEEQLAKAAEGLNLWKGELDQAAPQLAEGKKQITKGEEKLDAAKKKLESGEKELNQAKDKLERAGRQIKEAKEKLAEEEKKLKDAAQEIADGELQLAEAEKQAADGEREIADALKEIEENEQKLLDGQQEYEDARQEAEDTIKDGEQKIADAEEDVRSIKKPEWTISDRSDMLEYDGYGENAERMRNIGRVFPVIFFLVAALISLTTMTRMVEEERTQIGTLKALGYGKASIAAKYTAYALLATLSGSILGVLVGEKILPYIIIRAYGIMYQYMDVIRIPYNPKYGVIATAAAVFCTMAATVEACGRELQAWPAVLMRPPAPKQGKRVWIERIPLIWNHLSFTWKSTVRNLFRYKKRFFMTVIGIGGCMGLLLVGFGLRDSIMDVGILQYQELQLYDGQIILDEDADEEETQELLDSLGEDSAVETFTKAYMKKEDVFVGDRKREAYLMVLPDAEHAEQFIHFRDRRSREEYHLEDDTALLTEKTAKLLGVAAGGSIYMKEKSDDVQIPVGRICENYMSHYVYMTEKLYRSLYGEIPEYNSVLYRVDGREEEAARRSGEHALQCEAALSVTYTGSIKDQIDHMLGSLDLVIVVLIVSAGMLAFLVLYNLNNININERRRELATIKVLGFYDREVAAYVYRENILLTVLGCVFGVFAGIVLHRFIIETVEVDVCMFGRNIKFISFLFAILLTFGFSIIVNFAMFFKLRRIDMVESLKSVE